jgi:muconolactone delta-isomerase
MEFLVEFDVNVPDGTSPSEIEDRQNGEAVAAAELVKEGHLVRLWRPPAAAGESKALGVYRAESRAQLDGLLADLPLSDWMHITVTPLEAHPNDPDGASNDGSQHPEPRLTPVFRLEAALGQPRDLGDTDHGHRRIVPLTGGTFTGPELSGKLLPGASADWQTIMPDGTTLVDVRYTLQTDGGDILYVQSRGVRHGSAEVLARLARGEEVNPGEYTFRTATQIETAAAELDWLNKGVFVAVGGRQSGAVTYATYLVG